MSSISLLLELIESVEYMPYISNLTNDLDMVTCELFPKHWSMGRELYFLMLSRSATVTIVLNKIEVKTCYTRIFPLTMNKSRDHLEVFYMGVVIYEIVP